MLGNDAAQNDGVEWASSSQRAHVRDKKTTGKQPGRPPDTKKVSDNSRQEMSGAQTSEIKLFF